jgi:6-pyruvoyltetrahydropterin/6-carboxytetrahydropterin synthase
MNVEVKTFFCAAHQLPDSEFLVQKKCANLHGHTYGVVVSAESDELKGGMVVDFKGIKNIIDDTLDHKFVNDVFTQTPGWEKSETTAENIALFLAMKISKAYPLLKISIKLCEGYKGPESTSWVQI